MRFVQTQASHFFLQPVVFNVLPEKMPVFYPCSIDFTLTLDLNCYPSHAESSLEISV